MYKEKSLESSVGTCPANTCRDETLRQFLKSLGNAIDAKDHSTGSHSEQVARIAEAIGWVMGLSGQGIDLLHMAGLLHDIGKIGIPDSVLTKPGPLTDEEWEIITEHPAKGAAIVRPVAEFSSRGGVADMVLHHHERYDGQGYPNELKGDAIPLGARIIAVADSLSTMMQDRPYRPASTFEDAVKEIVKCSGTAYHPDVVEAFMTVKDDIRQVVKSD